MLLGSFYIARR